VDEGGGELTGLDQGPPVLTWGPWKWSNLSMRSGLLRKALATLVVGAAVATATQGPWAAAAPSDSRTIVHVLNRIGFGARPGDVEAVRAMGLQNYIDLQLHPERISDSAMQARLAGLTTIDMSSREIVQEFALPAQALRRARQQSQKNQPDQQNDSGRARQQSATNQPNQQTDPGQMQPPPFLNAAQQQANRPMMDLSSQKMLRAIYSERQLQEVLVDFWFNHFNVDARKGQTRFMLTEYERDAIRPHVLGKFRDLLGATAKSPAMLFYLDNWMSADPAGPHLDAQARTQGARRARQGGRRGPFPTMPPPQQQANAQRNTPRGLNENYGRELMELHTLGVDGGYTQKDVTEVARAFTGWTIQNPRLGGGYVFNARMHDPGQKVVLGHTIKAGGGERDGEQVLDILASHPSTARFVSMKLARRFVGDDPPAALVDRLAATFRRTDGDLREVMRTLLTSSEFLSPDAYRAKVKTPFEFVVSAVRATGSDLQDATPLVRAMQQLGMPLYLCQPPTGYKDTADAWVNSGALVSRMNFALLLAGNNLRAAGAGGGRARGRFQTPGAAPSATERNAQLVLEQSLNDDVSTTTRDTIKRATTPEQQLALVLGSPEFQRR
jgi:uncharacterized protein (DUF1800 family)